MIPVYFDHAGWDLANPPAQVIIPCQECGESHVAEYSHESQFSQGPIYAVICPADGQDLTDFYTLETAQPVKTNQPKGNTK